MNNERFVTLDISNAQLENNKSIYERRIWQAMLAALPAVIELYAEESLDLDYNEVAEELLCMACLLEKKYSHFIKELPDED